MSQCKLPTDKIQLIYDKYSQYPKPLHSNSHGSMKTSLSPLAIESAPKSLSNLTSLIKATESVLKVPLQSLSQQSDQSDKHDMSVDGFTSFLLSNDNSPFSDQSGQVWQDMTRPLPEYYISSSHNTYLVGHQLVGTSTIEGYIRALLHSCRSVERKQEKAVSNLR